jgi:hypothetical protein
MFVVSAGYLSLLQAVAAPRILALCIQSLRIRTTVDRIHKNTFGEQQPRSIMVTWRQRDRYTSSEFRDSKSKRKQSTSGSQ